MLETTFSDRYKIFLGILGVTTLFSLLVMNEFTTILESEEAFNILHVQQQMSNTAAKTVAPFPNTSQYLIYSFFGFNPFMIRMSNVVVFLLLLLGIRIWSGKIFGKKQSITFIILILSSFLIISMAKFAVADIPLAAFHMMSMIFLIICLKQPKLKWQIVYGLFVIGSFLVQPLTGVVYGVGLLTYMTLFHKKGANLRKPVIIGVWVILITIFYFLGGFDWNREGFIFSFRSHSNEYLLWMMIGILPWIGFLPAALWDLFQKLRKKEEMAIILFGWLVFSIVAHALILQLCLLFLISKQVENYFKPNYPYKSLVRGFSVLNLIVTFFALVALMLGSFALFHNFGFKSAAAFSAVYWIFGFVGIIGLFMDNRSYVLGGIGLAGAICLLIFWVQISPVINNFRDISQRLLEGVEKGTSVMVSDPLFSKNQFKVYGNLQGVKYEKFQAGKPGSELYLLNEMDYKEMLKQNQSIIPIDTIIGRTDVLSEPELFYRLSVKKD